MIVNLNNLEEQLGRKPKIGFTCSTFDLGPHAGHIAMLAEARSLCDYLVVGLLTDPTIDRPGNKNKPVQSVFERYLQLSACKYVDHIIPFSTEQEIVDIILTINPDIRIVGEEYKDTNHTGRDLCPIHYNKRRHSFSTTELRQRVVDAELKKASS
jgi:glycerol-3-phosphate cytidylyltransferase